MIDNRTFTGSTTAILSRVLSYHADSRQQTVSRPATLKTKHVLICKTDLRRKICLHYVLFVNFKKTHIRIIICGRT